MAIIASDTFNRADNPSSLGSADTGQLWVRVPVDGNVSPGDPYGIVSGKAFWNRDGSGIAGDGLVVLETGFRDLLASVDIIDPTAGGHINLRNQGIVIRYVDALHYVFLTFYGGNEGGIGSGFRLYVADGGAAIHSGPDCFFTLSPGDTIGIAACGQTITAYVNGVIATNYPITFSDAGPSGPALSPTLLAGTKCGLQAQGGVISGPPFQQFDNFLVETNDACPSSPSESASPSATPSASPSAEPCTPPIGRAISCVNARGRLFVTLANDDFTSQIAYAWHEGAQRMPITSVTNWKRAMRALTLQELDVAFETDNPDPLNPMIVSVHRNLRRNYVRDARVNAGSDRVDSLTAQFDSDNIGDMVVVFGQNIGGDGVHYILGRIAETASPSSSPSPSASPSASPSVTESASPSLSPSASPSSSRSGSPSPSHSPSASPSASPSRSGSASPSVTPSASPSASPSSSPSSSQSASPSAS
jgi:hypothetical protein